METINVAVPADLMPLLRQMLDDKRSWAVRMQHDWSAQPGLAAAQYSSDAGRTAGACAALVRAIDAAQEAAR